MTTVSWGGSPDPSAAVVLVHYGSPHTGRHLPVLSRLADDDGLRIAALPRPGYGDAPRRTGRTVGDAARIALDALDAEGVDRFATLGYSGGGPHALAIAALAGDRVTRVATFASPAPYDGSPEWREGIRDRRGLEAALISVAARERQAETGDFDAESFTASDYAALEDRWADLGTDAQAATGSLGAVDDDVAFVHDWGVDLAVITAPVTLAHGADDRVVPVRHARLIAGLVPSAETRITPGVGHIGVLDALPGVLGGFGAR